MGKLLEMPRPHEPGEELNPEQRAAVAHGEGPLLVVAGAGTGKTHVITQRIRHLLETDPELSGENILGLTFTEKAAAEMKARVVAAVGERGESVWLSTFHAFCHSILLDINPGLQVLEEIDHWILLRRNLARLKLDHYKRLADPGRFLGDFVQFFSRCQDELVTPDDYQRYAEGLCQQYEQQKVWLDSAAQEAREAELARQSELARAYRASDALLRERNLVTFGALLLETVQQLRGNPELLGLLRGRYRHILVDEFQDTNIAQIELLWLLAGEPRNIVAVGDDDQAIYRFRGASFGSFKLFAEKFLGPNASPERHVVTLRQNYRSTRRILRGAGQSIAQNKDRYLPDKRLITANPEGERIRIVEFGRVEEEARWIAEEIERAHRGGRAWGEFAVLYRAHLHRDLLVGALARRAIPFVIRNLSILESPLVRDVMAYLRLVASPGDNVACARVLAAPAWGLEPADLVRLAERASKGKGLAIWDALRDRQGELGFAPKGGRTAELVDWITSLRRRAKSLRASELLEQLLRELLPGLNLVELPTEADHRALQRFAQFTRDWERKSETKTLWEFVEYLEYFREAGGQIALAEEDVEDAVQLMTVHAAKGLEFDHVFVMRLVRNAFPTRPRRPVLEFPAELMKEALPEGDFHVQEERRLFYVALTRARKRLTLATILNRQTKPSAFVDDLLLDEQVRRADVLQLAPKVTPERPEEEPPAQPQLFAPETLGSRACSRIAAWARRYHPPVFEPLQLSASAIDTFELCPQKYLFQRGWGIRGGPQAAMTFGSVMHTTIREFVHQMRRNRRIAFDELAAIYEREWSAAGYRDAYQEEEYRKAGLEQLAAFHRSYVEAPPEVLHLEQSFQLPLDGNVVVLGRIDQVNRLGPREAEIVDYKTGRPRLDKDAQKSLQLSLYALAAREVLELEPVRLTFYNLTTNQPVSSTREENDLSQARQTVQQVAAEIRAGQFPARPGYYCRNCEFQPLCPAHEQRVKMPQPAARGR